MHRLSMLCLLILKTGEKWMTDIFLSKFEFFKLQVSVILKAILIMRPDLIF